MFVRGGGISPGRYLLNAGTEGYNWSSVGRYSNTACYLTFYSGDVYPSNNIFRYYGFSVRCVALGG